MKLYLKCRMAESKHKWNKKALQGNTSTITQKPIIFRVHHCQWCMGIDCKERRPKDFITKMNSTFWINYIRVEQLNIVFTY